MDGEVNASIPTALPVDALLPFSENKAIKNLLVTECVVVEIMDPMFGIPAADRLFPTILKYLTK